MSGSMNDLVRGSVTKTHRSFFLKIFYSFLKTQSCLSPKNLNILIEIRTRSFVGYAGPASFNLQRVWGRIYSEKVWNQSSSNTKENGSGWGRVVSNIIFLESMDLQLSNALWIEWFGQKLAEIEDFEFGIFLKISKIDIDHFHFLCILQRKWKWSL